MNGCKLTFQNQVLYCHRYCTFDENLEACKAALTMLEVDDPFSYSASASTGVPLQTLFEEYRGKVARYSCVSAGAAS